MAKLTKAIFGVVDGEIYPREIEAGADCPVGLEAYAASIGALDGDLTPATQPDQPDQPDQPEPDAAPVADQPDDTKAAKKAPENK